MKETKLIAVQGKPLGSGVLPAIITPLVGSLILAWMFNP